MPLNEVSPEQCAKLYSPIELIFVPSSEDSSFIQPINISGAIFVNKFERVAETRLSQFFKIIGK